MWALSERFAFTENGLAAAYGSTQRNRTSGGAGPQEATPSIAKPTG